MKTKNIDLKDVMIVSLALNFGLAATIAFLVHLDFAMLPSRAATHTFSLSPNLATKNAPEVKAEFGARRHRGRI